MHEPDYRKVLSDADVVAQRERNNRRAEEAIVSLGSRYLCHPANRVLRVTRRRFANS